MPERHTNPAVVSTFPLIPGSLNIIGEGLKRTPRTTYAQQSVVRHVAAQEARHAGILQRPTVIVAYATEEILLILSLGGLAFFHLAWYASGAIVVLLAVVVASYRQTCKALSQWWRRVHRGERQSRPIRWPDGGQRTTRGLCAHGRGLRRCGSCGDHFSISALSSHAVGLSVGSVVLLTLVNLRGVKESGKAFTRPDLRLPDRDLRHVRSRWLPAPIRRATSGADSRLASSTRALLCRPRVILLAPGRSPRAAPR